MIHSMHRSQRLKIGKDYNGIVEFSFLNTHQWVHYAPKVTDKLLIKKFLSYENSIVHL